MNDSKEFEFFHSYLNPFFLNYRKFDFKKKCRPKLVYLLGFEPPVGYRRIFPLTIGYANKNQN